LLPTLAAMLRFHDVHIRLRFGIAVDVSVDGESAGTAAVASTGAAPTPIVDAVVQSLSAPSSGGAAAGPGSRSSDARNSRARAKAVAQLASEHSERVAACVAALQALQCLTALMACASDAVAAEFEARDTAVAVLAL
jgi:hypothetical protein